MGWKTNMWNCSLNAFNITSTRHFLDKNACSWSNDWKKIMKLRPEKENSNANLRVGECKFCPLYNCLLIFDVCLENWTVRKCSKVESFISHSVCNVVWRCVWCIINVKWLHSILNMAIWLAHKWGDEPQQSTCIMLTISVK